MRTVNRNPPASSISLEIESAPALSAGNPGLAPLQAPPEARRINHRPVRSLPRLVPRNAPLPNEHVAIDIPPRSASAEPEPVDSPRRRLGQTGPDPRFTLPTSAPGSSRDVPFQRKLAAALKTGLGIAVPFNAINVAADMAGGTIIGTVDHAAGSFASNLAVGATAAGFGLVGEVAATVAVTAFGHAYLDEKFYHAQGKTADEMIAAKKANAAGLAYIGGTGTSVAMTLAATALTGGTVTANVAKNAAISHFVGGMVAHPLMLAATAGAIAYHAKFRPDRAPDSLQAGIEGYVNWARAKLPGIVPAIPSAIAPLPARDGPAVAPGDDMV